MVRVRVRGRGRGRVRVRVSVRVRVWVLLYSGGIVLFALLLPLKEMLFREGREGLIHVVLRFASSEDVGDLYLVLPSCNVSLWN